MRLFHNIFYRRFKSIPLSYYKRGKELIVTSNFSSSASSSLKLNEVGIFNSALMNQAVFAFKRFEEASLSYAGGISLSNYAGGFDTVVKREDLKRMTDG